MRFAIVLSFVLLLASTGATNAQVLDAAGNYIDDNSVPTPPGDVCGTCPNPGGALGVDFKGNDLLALSDNLIYRMQNCSVVETISIVPPPSYGFEIGYDSTRDLYVIADPSADRIYLVNAGGSVVNSYASPGAGPVGAAYDPGRDLYWITDWEQNRIMSLNAGDGTPGPSYAAPAGSRIAGTGYDAVHDAIVYHGRDQAMGFWISAADGSLISSYNVPGGGQNNGNGVGVDPSTNNAWLAHYELPDLYCVEGLGGGTPARDVTWGRLRSMYR